MIDEYNRKFNALVKLFPEGIKDKIPSASSQHREMDPIIYCRLVHSGSGCEWLVLGLDRWKRLELFVSAFLQRGSGELEWNIFILDGDEIRDREQKWKGVERDFNFAGGPLSGVNPEIYQWWQEREKQRQIRLRTERRD